MTRPRSEYTVWVRCHIYGHVSRYFLTAESEAAVFALFATSPDELLDVRPGWQGFYSWCGSLIFQPTVKPPWTRVFPWKEPPAYDWRQEEEFY